MLDFKLSGFRLIKIKDWYQQCMIKASLKLWTIIHSGIYGHKNETQILEIVAFIMQFYTYFNTYDMN